MADPRVKLEEALRKAGLHQNPYARVMLKDAKPLKPPRKDQESTVFKDINKWCPQEKSSKNCKLKIFCRSFLVLQINIKNLKFRRNVQPCCNKG